jgi:hypothetical protein
MIRADDTIVRLRREVLTPQARAFGRRRFRVALLLLPAVVMAVVWAARVVTVSQDTVEEDVRSARRLLVYPLATDAPVRLLLEPRTDAVRLVLHALDCEDDGEAKGVRVRATFRGATVTRSETLDLSLPGTRARVASERAGAVAFDPLVVPLDASGVGRGDLELALLSAPAGCAVALRAYAREAIRGAPPIADEARAPSGTRMPRGARTGPPEQTRAESEPEHGHGRGHEAADVAAEAFRADADSEETPPDGDYRFRKVVPIETSGQELVPIPLVLARTVEEAPPPAPAATGSSGASGSPGVSADQAVHARVVATAGDRVAFLARGHGVVRIVSTASAAAVTTSIGDPVDLAAGEAFALAVDDAVAWTMAPSGDTELLVVSGDAIAVERDTPVRTTHVIPGRALSLEADDEPITFRIGVRRPAPSGPVPVAMVVTIKRRRSVRDPRPLVSRQRYAAVAPPSRWETYACALPADGAVASAEPAVDRGPLCTGGVPSSERASFYVTVPRFGEALLEPEHDPLDVTLAEVIDADASAASSDTELPPRRASNAEAFADETRIVRVLDGAKDLEREPTVDRRAARPVVGLPAGGGERRLLGGLPHAAAQAVTFRVGRTPPSSLVVPVFAEQPASIAVSIESGPARRRPGLATRASLSRRFDVGPGSSRIVLPLGDDLERGEHRANVRALHGATRVWVRDREEAPRWMPAERAP